MSWPVDPLAVSVPTLLAGALLARYATVWLEMARLPGQLADERRRIAQASAAASADDLDLVVVVVPALSEYATLRRTLPAVLAAAGAESRTRIEVVVVTTERERSSRRELLASLAGSAVEGSALRRLVERHGGIDEELVTALCREAERGAPAAALCALVDRWPCTWDLAGAFPSVTWLHSPRADGRMATQLNFVVDHIDAGVPAARGRESTYVCVYNADTLAQPDSFTCLVETLLAHGRPAAAQLMCVPLLNLAEFAASSGAASAYLAGAAIYQARWALGREFRMYRATARRPGRPYYCRGHGMTVRLDTLLRHGGFEERTALEDMFCGHLLSIDSCACPAVPLVEATASPQSLPDLIRQKAYWFSGMLDLVHYGRWVAERGLGYRGPLQRARLVAAGLARDVLPWLAGPTVALAVVVWASQRWWPWLILPALNAVCSAVLVLRLMPDGPAVAAALGPWARLRLAVGTLAYAATRNVGPVGASMARATRRPVMR